MAQVASGYANTGEIVISEDPTQKELATSGQLFGAGWAVLFHIRSQPQRLLSRKDQEQSVCQRAVGQMSAPRDA